MISLLHPTRKRLSKSRDTMTKWIERSDSIDFEFIISVDDDDDSYFDWIPRINTSISVIKNKNRSAVDAINNAAKVARGDILIVVSDDSDCPEQWVKKIFRAVNGETDWILKTQDGTQPWIITMPIMDRSYYNRFGYIYYPEYRHMFCDTELTCVADITGRKITSNLLFKHNHYSVTKETPDEVSKRADKTWDQGEKLFLERYKRNFDLPPGRKIQDKGMINWLQRKAR